MNAQVKDRVRYFGICNAFRNQQSKETPRPPIFQVYLGKWFGQISLIMEDTYIAVVDFYSKYFEIELLRQNTRLVSLQLILEYHKKSLVIMDHNSAIERICLKNLSHQFKQFAREWGFTHTTSSPEFANVATERAV